MIKHFVNIHWFRFAFDYHPVDFPDAIRALEFAIGVVGNQNRGLILLAGGLQARSQIDTVADDRIIRAFRNTLLTIGITLA